LNTVIIILHCLTRAENSRLAITAAHLVAFPELNIVDVSDVGISVCDRASSREDEMRLGSVNAPMPNLYSLSRSLSSSCSAPDVSVAYFEFRSPRRPEYES
jgi:hypothetical protein